MEVEMTSKTYKWCPNGCGKKVISNLHGQYKYVYECQICNTKFTKEEIEEYWK